MHFSGNRTNHDFQIKHFLAGACHTADAAYGLLTDQKDNRADAIKAFEGSRLKQQAKLQRAMKIINAPVWKFWISEEDKLDAKGDIAEMRAHEETLKKNYEAALAELSFLNSMLNELKPQCKYSHLPLAEANELIQQEEWKLELIERAQNSMLTTNSIPTDQFATMRLHPEFQTAILPSVEKFKTLMLEGYAHPEKPEVRLSYSVTELLDMSKEETKTFSLPDSTNATPKLK